MTSDVFSRSNRGVIPRMREHRCPIKPGILFNQACQRSRPESWTHNSWSKKRKKKNIVGYFVDDYYSNIFPLRKKKFHYSNSLRLYTNAHTFCNKTFAMCTDCPVSLFCTCTLWLHLPGFTIKLFLYVLDLLPKPFFEKKFKIYIMYPKCDPP